VLALMFGACPGVTAELLGLGAALCGMGVDWRITYVGALPLPIVVLAIGLAACRRELLRGAGWTCN